MVPADYDRASGSAEPGAFVSGSVQDILEYNKRTGVDYTPVLCVRCCLDLLEF